MITNEKNIGKVSISCDGVWDIKKDYDKLCLVTDGSYNYISRKQVPMVLILLMKNIGKNYIVLFLLTVFIVFRAILKI